MSLESWSGRLARYQYISRLTSGHRVLELGCGSGEGAHFLAQCATRVLSMDTSRALIAKAQARWRRKNLRFVACDPLDLGQRARSFGCIVVPELEWWVAKKALVAEVCRLLAPKGLALFAVRSDAEARAGGMSYEAFTALLKQGFAHVNLVAEIPFVGVTLVDFDPQPGAEPELDGFLVAEEGEPSHYVALCSNERLTQGGYALLQLPDAEQGTDAERETLEARLAEQQQQTERLAAEVARLQAAGEANQWRQDELDGWRKAADRYQREAARAKAQLAQQAQQLADLRARGSKKAGKPAARRSGQQRTPSEKTRIPHRSDRPGQRPDRRK